MSRWARKSSAFSIRNQEALPNPLESSAAGRASGVSSSGSPILPDPQARFSFPWWMKVAPFFLSAALFLTGFFAVFSPLPLLLAYFHKSRRWAWLASLTNALVVFGLTGWSGVAIYLILVLVTALSLSEWVRLKLSMEMSVLLTLLTVFVVGVGSGLVYCSIHHLSPMNELREYISQSVNTVFQTLNSSQWMTTESDSSVADLEEWKRSFLVEFPSAVAICALAFVWANIVLLFKMNPGKVRERLGLDAQFLQKWKASEFLVWPTIISGFFLLFDAGTVTDVALNCFKFLMAIYALQGLSILSYFFDLWGIRGLFRGVGFVIAVLLMTPLLLSLGFFDLWFDFRAKLKQS